MSTKYFTMAKHKNSFAVSSDLRFLNVLTKKYQMFDNERRTGDHNPFFVLKCSSTLLLFLVELIRVLTAVYKQKNTQCFPMTRELEITIPFLC